MTMVHESVTEDLVLTAMQESLFGMSDIGYCIGCGAEHYQVEPDAEGHPCDTCGADAVYGAEPLLYMVCMD